jgi:hypothetical protein
VPLLSRCKVLLPPPASETAMPVLLPFSGLLLCLGEGTPRANHEAKGNQ